ncbi:DUF3265 domain-containing protein [Vibrio cholerae]
MSLGGKNGLRKLGLCGIHPLTRRYVFFQLPIARMIPIYEQKGSDYSYYYRGFWHCNFNKTKIRRA